MSTPHETRRGRLRRSYLAHAPERLVQWTAQALARGRPVGIEPGWKFDVAADDPSELVQFRRDLWNYFRDRSIEHPVALRWYDGLRVRMFLGNDMSLCLYVGASFEPNEFALLDVVLREGMVVVDGGANDGLYSLFASRRVGASGHVLAVEPSSREYERLLANLELNRTANVTPLKLALGSREGDARLAIAEDGHEGQNTIGETVSNPTVATRSHELVHVTTLDGLAEEQQLEQLDVLKLDVEGSELEALRGGYATIDRFRPLMIVEAETERLASQNATVDDVVVELEKLEYALYVFDSDTGQLRPPHRPDEPEGNVVAAPNGWQPPRLSP